MEFTNRKKILRNYGNSLVKDFLEETKREHKGYKDPLDRPPFLAAFDYKINDNIEFIQENFEKKYSRRIIQGIAENLLKKGFVESAYKIYVQINPRKAKTIEKLFPKDYLILPELKSIRESMR